MRHVTSRREMTAFFFPFWRRLLFMSSLKGTCFPSDSTLNFHVFSSKYTYKASELICTVVRGERSGVKIRDESGHLDELSLAGSVGDPVALLNGKLHLPGI